MNVVAEAVRLNLQVAVPAASAVEVPPVRQFSRWVNAALPATEHVAAGAQCITVRLVDAEESAHFNQLYRGLPRPTNVLAFPPGAGSIPPPATEEAELGDLLICWPLVQAEAAEQDKSSVAHLAHLTVHGTLHLLGYDHEEPADAAIMEGLEQRIMRGLDFPNPYAADA